MNSSFKTQVRSLMLIPIMVATMGSQKGFAQDDDLRRDNWIDTSMVGDPVLIINPNATAQNCLLEWHPSIGSPPVTLSMPFQRPGSTSITGGAAYSEVLISGWKLNNIGVLCRISIDTDNLEVTIIESREYAGIDPLSIAFTGTRLFVMDLLGGTILTTPYSDGGPLPSLQDFETAHTFGGSTYTQRISPIFDAAEQLLPNSCKVRSVYPYGTPMHLSPGAQGGWIYFNPNELGEEGYTGPYHVTNSTSVNSSGPVLLWGKTGNYVVRNLDTGLDVASGVVSNSEVVFAAIPSQDMELGIPHAVMSPTGEDVSNTFYPSVRYGSPMVFPTAAFDEGDIFGGRIVRGDSDFTTSVWLGFDEPTTGPLELPVTVWWNWRDETTGQDPVILVGQSAQLIGAAGFRDMTLSVSKNALGQEMGLEIPIPGDPNLIGRVLLFQWATLTPDTPPSLVLSDVYGSVIQDVKLVGIGSTASATQPVAQPKAQMTVEEVFQATSKTLKTPLHDLLRAKIKALAEARTKGK